MLKQEEITKINRDFRIVFTAKRIENEKRKRIFVSANTLTLYIGKENANKLIQAIKTIKVDKVTLKYRKHGKIEIYSK
ncbi:hypothetical protein D3C85_322570 [compost metagenome]